MHASIGHYAAIGAATDEVIQATRQLATALSHTPGFVSYALLDMGDGTLASISIFESRLELDAGDRLVGAWLAEHLPSVPGAVPPPEIGEIVLQRGM
jgi:hypothetical protein